MQNELLKIPGKKLMKKMINNSFLSVFFFVFHVNYSNTLVCFFSEHNKIYVKIILKNMEQKNISKKYQSNIILNWDQNCSIFSFENNMFKKT